MTTQRSLRKPATKSIHQLKVTLRGSRPPIWRRLQVPSHFTLGDLHWILQDAFGWWEGHLHQFIVGESYYGEPSDEDDDWGMNTKDEDRARLDQIAPTERAKFVYEYDFGDGWEHIMLVETILPPEPGVTYPRCVAGRRAGPLEDSGGIWGYQHLIEVLGNPSAPEYEEMREWAGEKFDPAVLSLEQINEKLSKLT
jgi:hypothetical protein